MNKGELKIGTSQILIYEAPNGNIKIDVILEDETVWLSQEQMALLFGKGRSTITEHIRNAFAEGELQEEVVCRDFRHTTQHGAIAGKTQEVSVNYYNLDVIISVGYRVKSHQGTQFRIWATQRLREYIVKGFALNDERFKSGNSMNYFTDKRKSVTCSRRDCQSPIGVGTFRPGIFQISIAAKRIGKGEKFKGDRRRHKTVENEK